MGEVFTTAEIQHSKKIFAVQVRHRGTLVRTIYKAPSSSADGNLRTGFFLDLLRRGLSTDDVQQQLDTAIIGPTVIVHTDHAALGVDLLPSQEA
jgi:NitT/TauT family transport system ATP-binding protein